MRWHKRGVIYVPDGRLWWAQTHAMLPTPELRGNIIRLYLCCQDERGEARIGYVDVSTEDPRHVVEVGSEPLLDIGYPGHFDQDGILATCVVPVSDTIRYLYYVGFERGHKARYRLLTGLAISEDGGQHFRRIKTTPILERSSSETLFRCGPFVRYEEGRFRMWYVAGSSWTDIGGKAMPVYDLRYTESDDGIHWPEAGEVCLEIRQPEEHGFGRPWIIKEGGYYHLFYSIRRRSLGAYRMGYARSVDGRHWERRDHDLNLDVSPEGWDSQAIMYAAVLPVGGRFLLFYNGNDFGRTGMGYAETNELAADT